VLARQEAAGQKNQCVVLCFVLVPLPLPISSSGAAIVRLSASYSDAKLTSTNLNPILESRRFLDRFSFDPKSTMVTVQHAKKPLFTVNNNVATLVNLVNAPPLPHQRRLLELAHRSLSSSSSPLSASTNNST
jgi:hypothetical protein